MLGRTHYRQEELDHASGAIKQLLAYKKLVKALKGAGEHPKVQSALEDFEPLLFNNMTLVLDHYIVHGLRMTTGKDANPINDVELLSGSLMNNDGELRDNNVVKYIPDESVMELDVGDHIRINAAQFERLSKACLAEPDSEFVR